MTKFFDITLFFQSSFLLFIIENLAFLAKLSILIFFGLQAFRKSKISKSLLLVAFVLLGGLLTDFTWIIKLYREIIAPDLDYRIIIFFIRISWAFSIIQFQSLSAFIESLSEKKYKIKLYQKILLCFNSVIVLYFLYLAFLKFLTVPL
jgi:hypothetical protein